ncbi:MAG: 23S rRNA (adenine(2030)-N(6))-methyltransferase RlmJ [Xanthobacteraceae bacterium]
MNYRHAFHAGNFADVLKHVVLARILLHLREKPAAFRVIDTHAGAGLYDLLGPEASRTGEWRNGIARVLAAAPPADVANLLAPYLEAILSCHPDRGGADGIARRYYPGSPLIALSLLRPQDRLIACEIEPSAAGALVHTIGGDGRAKVIEIDGYVALNAYLPPKERRGLVLVDPPFEQPDEFSSLLRAVAKVWRKWPTGTYMLWYPLKDRLRAAAFSRELAGSVSREILRAELDVDAGESGLTAAGLLIINPPWRLADELQVLLGWLAPALAEAQNFTYRLDRVRGEK